MFIVDIITVVFTLIWLVAKCSDDSSKYGADNAPYLPPKAKRVETDNADTVTSESLRKIYDDLNNCQKQRRYLLLKIASIKSYIRRNRIIYFASLVWVVDPLIGLLSGHVWGWTPIYNRISYTKRMAVKILQKQLDGCVVRFNDCPDAKLKKSYRELTEAFNVLQSASGLWDVTTVTELDPYDRFKERTHARHSINRIPVSLEWATLDLFRCPFKAMRFPNRNGTDLYIYPYFLLVKDAKGKFGLVDIRNAQITCAESDFHETETVPADSDIVSWVWYRANKDGSPDRRFNHNPRTPVCRYAKINICSVGGLNECYLVSCPKKAGLFVSYLQKYKNEVTMFQRGRNIIG